jgi:hypothetical protein
LLKWSKILMVIPNEDLMSEMVRTHVGKCILGLNVLTL